MECNFMNFPEKSNYKVVKLPDGEVVGVLKPVKQVEWARALTLRFLVSRLCENSDFSENSRNGYKITFFLEVYSLSY